jgi:hypothetical protein
MYQPARSNSEQPLRQAYGSRYSACAGRRMANKPRTPCRRMLPSVMGRIGPLHPAEASDIPAGPGQRRSEAGADGIVDEGEYDGNRLGFVRKCGRRRGRG